jgi:hypothetical protein
MLFNFDCRELYGTIYRHCAGPHKVFVTQNSLVLGGSGNKFHFFSKGRQASYQRSIPFPPGDHHGVWGQFIYSLPTREREYDLVYMFDLDGKLIRKLSVALEALGSKHRHQEKRQFILAGGRFYLFEINKLLLGTFSPEDPSGVLLVQKITDWNPDYHCYAVFSEDEMFANVFYGILKKHVLCLTSTAQITQLITDKTRSDAQNSSPSLSDRGLTVSDWPAGEVRLFQ